MKKEQHVCLVCGFNMVGFHPDTCPFCGARKERMVVAPNLNDIILKNGKNSSH
jgi:hypothetical protein